MSTRKSRRDNRTLREEVEENFIRAIKPNPIGAAIAKGTGKAKEFLDKAEVVYTGPGSTPDSRMGFGEIMFGQGPEAIDDWAHGFPPWEGKGQTWGLKPKAIDIAALPTFGALGLTKAAGKAGVKGLAKTVGRQMDVPVDVSRRGFLKNTGAVATTGVVGASLLPHLGEALAKSIPKVAVKQATRAVRMPAKEVLHTMSKSAMRKYKNNLDMWGDAWSRQGNRYPKQRKQQQVAKDAYEALGDDFDVSTVYTKEQLKDIDDFIARLPDDIDEEDALRRILGDPDAAYPNSVSYGEMGSKADDWDNVYWHEKNTLDLTKEDRAAEALYLLDERDVDMWIATGRVPKDYPDELVPYLSRDVFGEASGKISGWNSNFGLEYGPEDQLHRYIDSFVKESDNLGLDGLPKNRMLDKENARIFEEFGPPDSVTYLDDIK